MNKVCEDKVRSGSKICLPIISTRHIFFFLVYLSIPLFFSIYSFMAVLGLWCFLWLRRAGALLSRCGARASHGAMVKNPPTDTGDIGDTGLIPGSGRPPGEGNGNPFQYSCLGNLMDKRAWEATVHGVAKSRTQLSDWAHSSSCCGAQALELGLSVCGSPT